MPLAVILIIAFSLLTLPLTMWAIAHISGWRSLARRFPAQPPAPDADRGFGSLGFSHLGGYNNCIFWRADDDHLHLRVMVPFNIFHRPLSVPWANIEIPEGRRRAGLVPILIDGRRYTVPPRATARELRVRAAMAAPATGPRA